MSPARSKMRYSAQKHSAAVIKWYGNIVNPPKPQNPKDLSIEKYNYKLKEKINARSYLYWIKFSSVLPAGRRSGNDDLPGDRLYLRKRKSQLFKAALEEQIDDVAVPLDYCGRVFLRTVPHF